jgi:hypothetical protein
MENQTHPPTKAIEPETTQPELQQELEPTTSIPACQADQPSDEVISNTEFVIATPADVNSPSARDHDPYDDLTYANPSLHEPAEAPPHLPDPDGPLPDGLLILPPPVEKVTTYNPRTGSDGPPDEITAVHPDGYPFGANLVRDTYGLPNIITKDEHLPTPKTIREQISPDTGTPEYEQRPERIRELYRRHRRETPLPELHTLDDYEQLAITMMRCYKAYPDLYQLIPDIRHFCFPDDPDEIRRYFRPYERAGNWIRADVVDSDAAPTNLYLQRARKKAAICVNRMIGKAANGEHIDETKVRNMLALSVAAKYIKQSEPAAKTTPRRPASEKTIDRLLRPAGRGGKRPGAGRPRKKKSDDEDNQKTGLENR